MIDERSSNPLQATSFVVQGALLAFILVFVSLVPISFAATDFRLSFLPLAAIVIWPVKASYSWSVICVFCIGLLRDVLEFGPLGIWALTYLLVFVLFFGTRDIKKGGAEYWVFFVIACLIAIAIIASLGRIILGAWPQWQSMFLDAFISIIAFPIVYLIVKTIGSIFGISITQEQS